MMRVRVGGGGSWGGDGADRGLVHRQKTVRHLHFQECTNESSWIYSLSPSLDHGNLSLLNVIGWLKIFPPPSFILFPFPLLISPYPAPISGNIKMSLLCIFLLVCDLPGWVLFCAPVLSYPNGIVLQIAFCFSVRSGAVRGPSKLFRAHADHCFWPRGVQALHFTQPFPLWWTPGCSQLPSASTPSKAAMSILVPALL